MSLKGTLLLLIPSMAAMGAQNAASGPNEDGLVPPMPRKKLTSDALIHGPWKPAPVPQGNPPVEPTASGFVVSVVADEGSANARSQLVINASVFTGLALTGRFKLRPRFAL